MNDVEKFRCELWIRGVSIYFSWIESINLDFDRNREFTKRVIPSGVHDFVFSIDVGFNTNVHKQCFAGVCIQYRLRS